MTPTIAMQDFYNDRDRREFISAGAAAGYVMLLNVGLFDLIFLLLVILSNLPRLFRSLVIECSGILCYEDFGD